MYIRRKVFSVISDPETGEEKFFSTTEVSLEQREYGNAANKALKKAWEKGLAKQNLAEKGISGRNIHDRMKSLKDVRKARKPENVFYNDSAFKEGMKNDSLNTKINAKKVLSEKAGWKNRANEGLNQMIKNSI